jgi:hypothetical protein
MTKNRCSRVSLVLSIAVGAFLVCAVSAQAEDGFTNGCVGNVLGKKANCTANDVRLTAVVGEPNITETCAEGPSFCVGGANAGDACTVAADCPSGGCFNRMTFEAIGEFTAGPQRYDVGVYIATDGDPNGDGARTGFCERFRFDPLEQDAVDLDGDQCGDILANSTQPVAFGPVTVACIDTDGNGSVDIINCETWGNGADEVPSQGEDCDEIEDVRAGTPSKCSCGLLPICIAIPDGNTCDTEVCRFTCSPESDVECDPTSATACDSAPEDCTERVVHVDLPDDTSCGGAGDQCNDPDTCQEGVCVAGGPKQDGTDCEAAPTDTGQVCDAQDECTGGVCVEKVKAAGTECRAAGNECDAAENCDGSSPDCPADFCATTGPRPATHFCSTNGA